MRLYGQVKGQTKDFVIPDDKAMEQLAAPACRRAAPFCEWPGEPPGEQQERIEP
jgi:hypothetical protein